MIFRTKNAYQGLATALVFVSVGSATLLGGCGGSDGPGSCSANACIKDENNYKASGQLHVQHAATKAEANLKVSWDKLTTNLLKRTINPVDDIDSVTFLQIPNMTEEQITTQFASGTFDQGKVRIYRTYRVDGAPGQTSATLDQFRLGQDHLNPSTEYTVDAKVKYMLLFATGNQAGVGTQSMLFLDPSTSESVEEVSAPQGGDILSFTATLSSVHVTIPKGGPYVVDWSLLSKDARGNTVVYEDIDNLLLGFYTKTVAELEADALNYDISAKTMYKVAIPEGDKQMDLTKAKTDSGESFTSFDRSETGIWAVGLQCSKCQIPTPLAVALLDPT